MARLLTYLGPYRASVVVAFILILAISALRLVGPYLTKVAIDDYIAEGDLAGLNLIAGLYISAPPCAVRTVLLPGLRHEPDRPANHVRYAPGRYSGTCRSFTPRFSTGIRWAV